MHERVYESYPATPWKRHIAWVTWFLVGSTVVVFLTQLLALHIYGVDWVGEALAFDPQAFAEHRYWTLLTYAWAHAVEMFGDPSLFWLHIGANMILLVCLGPALEEFLGHVCYLALYLGGAMAAALVWYFFNRNSAEGIIGASGAIFALLAGAGTAAPRTRIVAYILFVLPVPMRLGVLAGAICGFEVVQILFGWMREVAHSAHLGGAVFGFLFVLVVRWSRRRRYLAH